MKHSVFLLFFLILLAGFAQDTLWTRRLDTGLEDIGVGVGTLGEDIVIAGVSGDTIYDWLVVRYNSSGDTLWTRTFDTGINDYAIDAVFDTQGNVLVTGYSFSFQNRMIANSSFILPSGPSSKDFFRTAQQLYGLTVKYSPSGETLWSRTLDMAFLQGVGTDNQGNVYVSGSLFIRNWDFLLAKYSPEGNLEWTKTFDFSLYDIGYRMVVDRNNNIIMTGYSGEGGAYDIVVLKFNPDGDTLWTRRFDLREIDIGVSTTTDEVNNIAVCGATGDDMWNLDFLVLKYDPLGNLLWTRTYDWDVNDQALGIGCDRQNNIFVTGAFSDAGLNDYLTIGFSPAGDTIMTLIFDNGSDDVAQDLAVNSANHIIVTGGSIGINYDFLTIKYHSIVGIEKSEKPIIRNRKLFTLTPSIMTRNSRLTLRLVHSDEVSLDLYDKNGRLITKLHQGLLAKGQYGFALKNLIPGVYFIKIKTKAMREVFKIAVME